MNMTGGKDLPEMIRTETDSLRAEEEIVKDLTSVEEMSGLAIVRTRDQTTVEEMKDLVIVLKVECRRWQQAL